MIRNCPPLLPPHFGGGGELIAQGSANCMKNQTVGNDGAMVNFGSASLMKSSISLM